MPQPREVNAILREWQYYSETIKMILPGDTKRFREASRRLGYPLMHAIFGLVGRIDDMDRWLLAEQRATERLTEQLADTQKEVRRLNAVVGEKESHIASLIRQPSKA